MKFQTLPATLVLAGFCAGPAAAQLPPTPPGGSPPSVQQQNEEIIKELRTIRALLESVIRQTPPPRPATGKVSNLQGYALGRPDAPLTMVEFTDLQCPYCRQFALTAFDEIRKNWIDTGKLRYISRDFPIDVLHPHAMAAARSARCAGEQGKFWEMRLTLVRNANVLSPDFMTKTAGDLKLDPKAFAACAASSKHDAAIQAELQEGAKLGIDGTPTFVIGRTTPGGIDGPMIVGALPYAQFDAKLKELLK
ncbi:MAG TPA: thioredoxin domain-containing protein [Vicinamibacterales bacterium]|nr:thioredoxin domain-containing protein [Vicinamibacterales bacterium]